MMVGQDTGGRRRYLIGLVEQSIAGYEGGAATLESLVTDIEPTIAALRDVADAEWVEELTSAWSGLETVYAVMLDETRSSMTQEDVEEVSNVIRDLRAVLRADAPGQEN